MASPIGTERCPKCELRGADRKGDNLAVYKDESAHCFACGFHRPPPFSYTFKPKEVVDVKEKALLPSDFSREVPPEQLRWLLQYGLPYSYWKQYIGYSEKENRLVITVGTPIKFSQGRAFTVGESKWKNYGNGHNFCETLGLEIPRPIVLVEDLISAHKVAQIAPAMCLFGTTIYDIHIKELIKLNRPVVLWLDSDQYSLLIKKMKRLQTFLSCPVYYVSNTLDPKNLSIEDIKDKLKEFNYD